MKSVTRWLVLLIISALTISGPLRAESRKETAETDEPSQEKGVASFTILVHGMMKRKIVAK